MKCALVHGVKGIRYDVLIMQYFTFLIFRKRFETGNDSNDRLIVNTAVYYKEILGKICDVIFVSNDVDNRVSPSSLLILE